MKEKALGIAILIMTACPVSAQNFYDDQEEGWFWYKEEPPPEEKDPKEPTPPVAKKEKEPEEKKTEVAKTTPPPGPKPLSTEWFNENLEKYRNQAIDDPTRENVEAYYRLQRIGLEKAQVFAEVAQQVVTANPYLDNTSARNPGGPSGRAQDKRARQNRRRIANEIWEEVGIAYFFDEECVLCEEQAPVLSRIANTYNLEILPVSLDGSPAPGQLASMDVTQDRGQSEMLEIDEAPAMYLVRPPGQFIPISDGYLLENQIFDRTIEVAYNEDWIDQEAYDSTRGINRERIATNVDDEIDSLPTESSELNEILRSME